MEVMLNHTTKPIVLSRPILRAACALEMCGIVAGGAEAFQRNLACPHQRHSGLMATPKPCKMHVSGRKGLPLLWIPINAGGVQRRSRRRVSYRRCTRGFCWAWCWRSWCAKAPVGTGLNSSPYNLQTMVGNYVLADGRVSLRWQIL
jgi:hypothetical protein